MEKLNRFLSFLILLSFFACTKSQGTMATVVKNCSGSYLKIEGKDYQVCNTEKIKKYDDGESVKVTYKNLNECTGTASQEAACAMLFSNEGWIEILHIK